MLYIMRYEQVSSMILDREEIQMSPSLASQKEWRYYEIMRSVPADVDLSREATNIPVERPVSHRYICCCYHSLGTAILKTDIHRFVEVSEGGMEVDAQ